MTAPAPVGLSDDQAEQEARAFLNEPIGKFGAECQYRVLAAMLQRVYAEGFVAGMDRAIATVKAGHR